jgi:aminoglycoside/choline kinase family phosphotransferase
MDDRQQQLQHWAIAALGLAGRDIGWTTVAGDASSRRYFRLCQGASNWICVDAPPVTENNQSFIEVRALLAQAGVRVPELLAQRLAQGFLLVEDLGDQLLLGVLSADAAEGYYRQAMELLLKLQAVAPAPVQVPAYSDAILTEELSRFSEWFCGGLLQLDLSAPELAIIEQAQDLLVESALEQPQTLVHLDFHSRNLLLLPSGELAAIDFQDARWGPLCYDLVSLLRDCYVRWPESQVKAWALHYRGLLRAEGHFAGKDELQFLAWFDLMGLQRHIKVLGNFSRLAIRDGKPGYLADIPQVLDYIVDVLPRYPQFSPLLQLLERRVLTRVEAAIREVAQ